MKTHQLYPVFAMGKWGTLFLHVFEKSIQKSTSVREAKAEYYCLLQ
jgi:hypothetical protein